MDENHFDLDDDLPPAKRRRKMEPKLSNGPLSDLLSIWGARRMPSSVSRWLRLSQDGNSQSNDSSTAATLTPSPGAAGFEDGLQTPPTPPHINVASEDEDFQPEPSRDSTEDELEGDTIYVARPRSYDGRKLRQRLNRAGIAATVSTSKKTRQGLRQKPVRLSSDITGYNSQTEVSYSTQAKRDCFFLAHKEYFLPLLPNKNYIAKLERSKERRETAEYELHTQPHNVLAPMKPYQLEGLSFLIYMYRNSMPAILGDEMGLGKTLQTLALFQYIKTNTPKSGRADLPFLVICPLSVLSSWLNEAEKWVPNLTITRFHGAKAEREKLKLMLKGRSGPPARFDILVTTYETFTAEEAWFKRAFVWQYCVLDEGHKIKNYKSNIACALQNLRTENRLLLTGTPLQNDLLEMWSLLHWLYPAVFQNESADNFKDAFNLSHGKASTTFMDDVRTLLELIMLRRTKSSVNLNLPSKEEVLLFVPLTPMQRFWYTRLLTKADNLLLEELFRDAKGKDVQSHIQEKRQESKLIKLGTDSNAWTETKEILQQSIQNEAVEHTSEWKKLMNILMQLRKVCSHPYLLPNAAPDPYYVGDHIKAASGKFIILHKLIDELVLKQKKKILIFSQFTGTLNLCEDLLALLGTTSLTDAPFRYLRFDGSTQRARRNLSIRMFNDKQSDYRIMLISTKAGGLGINLTSATDVVFMDEDWNPQITLQAEARAHRIGQTQKVTVYKLCSQGTVEEQMMGRIRKKLYLSAKIVDSMQNVHSPNNKKRKRGGKSAGGANDAPQLSTDSLKSLIRRGAQTLARPEINVTEMLQWDWETVLDQCKDKVIDPETVADNAPTAELERDWLQSMERVETAIFEGKKHMKQLEKEAKDKANLNIDRAERRIGKDVTVMVGGYAVNKESMLCADWEAVPTLAGKDPRLRDPVREKKPAVVHQDYCQSCWDGGNLVCCGGCPRSYHIDCLAKDFKVKLGKSSLQFYCPQHECADCKAKTVEAGGMLYRCRWCDRAFCEECLDWSVTQLVGDTLLEYEVLSFGAIDQAWYVECHECIKTWESHPDNAAWTEVERKRMLNEYEEFMRQTQIETVERYVDHQGKTLADSSLTTTPDTISEVATPNIEDFSATPSFANSLKGLHFDRNKMSHTKQKLPAQKVNEY